MGIIKDIFGKDNGITEDDLKNIIGKYQETSLVECKRATDSNYNYAFKTVIGFLNKPEDKSEGLLILGMDASKGVIEKIGPIKNNSFKQNTLRNKLLADIVSIPSSERSYALEVIEVPVIGGYVTLVETQKTYPNAVFYSKSANTAYIRYSDTTHNWPLGDMFKTATIKSYPVVYLNITIKSIKHIRNNTSEYSLNIIVRNSGTSPGRDITILLYFQLLVEKGNIVVKHSKDFIEQPPDSEYSIVFRYEISQRDSMPVYPGISSHLGCLDITMDNNSELLIHPYTYENQGVEEQEFILRNKKIIERKNSYKPYLH